MGDLRKNRIPGNTYDKKDEPYKRRERLGTPEVNYSEGVSPNTGERGRLHQKDRDEEW